MRANKTVSALIVLLFIFSMAILSFPYSAIALSGSFRPKAKAIDPVFVHHSEGEYERIQSVLEKEISDEKILNKIRHKLFSLSHRDIRLISSLCDRISHDSNSAAAHVAFLLITTIFIFS